MELALNILLVLLGVGAVFLSWDRRPTVKRWAPVLGLAAQPLWIAFGLASGGWFILVVSPLYGLGWARGLRACWARDGRWRWTP